MQVEVNTVAVISATVASMVIGAIWYHPKVMGKEWQKVTGISDKDMKEMGWSPILWALIRSALTAYILAHVIFLSNSFFGNEFLQDSLMTGCFMFFGFVGPLMFMHNGFENKRKKLSAITITQEFVTIMAMALTIGLIGL